MQPQGTVFYHFYRAVAALTAPLVWRSGSRKLTRSGIAPDRQREKLGHATLPRPDGALAWFHAASVGESLSVLSLAARMQALWPGLSVLITSGTASSAQILAKRLGPGMVHQFAPLDQAGALRRFLDHWRPEAGIFGDSEIWPQMLVEAAAQDVPLALVNARMSKTTLKNWQRFDHTARFLLGLFQVIRTQDQATLDGLRAVGADETRVQLGPNLKSFAAPLPVDADMLAQMRATLPGPIWLAASTHEGEEKQVLKAHAIARKTLPDLRLVLVPRHPERAEGIAALIRDEGFSVARRSAGDAPTADVYLADTLGEMGLWYALARVVFLGGSLGQAGGHNPYEPAQSGCAILTGPRYANFADVYAEFLAADALRIAKRPADLGKQVAALLTTPDEVHALGQAARDLAGRNGAALDDLAALLSTQVMQAPLPAAEEG